MALQVGQMVQDDAGFVCVEGELEDVFQDLESEGWVAGSEVEQDCQGFESHGNAALGVFHGEVNDWLSKASLILLVLGKAADQSTEHLENTSVIY